MQRPSAGAHPLSDDPRGDAVDRLSEAPPSARGPGRTSEPNKRSTDTERRRVEARAARAKLASNLLPFFTSLGGELLPLRDGGQPKRLPAYIALPVAARLPTLNCISDRSRSPVAAMQSPQLYPLTVKWFPGEGDLLVRDHTGKRLLHLSIKFLRLGHVLNYA